MTIGLLRFDIFIPGSNSLKARRMVLEGVKARLRSNFNLAVVQSDDEDKWQKASLAVAGIAKDRRDMESQLAQVINFVEKIDDINLIDYETELL